MAALGIMLLFAVMVAFDFKKVWKRKGLAEKWVYTMILGFALGLSELHVMGFHLIGLNQILDTIMKFIGLSV